MEREQLVGARFRGGARHPICSTQVRALAAMGTNLYAGGNFSTAGGNSADGIAQWNGSGWSPLGPGLGYVYALAVMGTDLYAGGEFLVCRAH